MNKAGGIISIIAGIFGVMAAIATLFVGGIGSAFKADGANQVIGFGWVGVLFSFLVIVFGAMAFYKPRFSGWAIIISSLFGIVLGGTLVAICMALSIIGGILTLFGKQDIKENDGYDQVREITTTKKKSPLVKISFGVLAIIAVLMVIGINSDKSPPINPLAQLEQEAPSELNPHGELAAMFAFGGNNTDLQRENRLKEITGKVVQWQLPVYDVKKSGNGYRIQTQGTVGGFMGSPVVGTFISITPRDDQEKQAIEALKTGDTISFKGRIADSTMRHLEIKPAILTYPNETAQQTKEAKGTPYIDQSKVEQQEQSTVIEERPVSEPIELSVNTPESLNNTQVRPDYEKCVTDNIPLSECSLSAYSIQDKRLNVAYKSVIGSSTELKEEQRAWIKLRDKSCVKPNEDSETYHLLDMYYLCLFEITQKRAIELEELAK
jgi:uncharacterized protein YecT (DUF1311 family)